MKNRHSHVYDYLLRLPFGLRRKIYSSLRPSAYKGLQACRFGNGAYDLRPFFEKRCVFVHIPKTAGASVKNAVFGRNCGCHFKLWQYQMILTGEEYKSFFKFCFVRNPWDRVFSAYRFIRQGGFSRIRGEMFEEFIKPYISFEDFVLNGLSNAIKNSCLLFEPQYRFVCDSNENIAVDYVGHVENLDHDLQRICQILKIDSVELGHFNRADGGVRKFENHYTREMIDKIRDLYQKDIRIFSYSWE